MEDRVLKSWEVSLTKQNCAVYDKLFKVISRKCANPECSYPLSALNEHFYSADAGGKICELCHTLEDSARQQPGLREAHDAWKRDQNSKKKMLDSKNYL
jgi:hypothetical protein